MIDLAALSPAARVTKVVEIVRSYCRVVEARHGPDAAVGVPADYLRILLDRVDECEGIGVRRMTEGVEE